MKRSAAVAFVLVLLAMPAHAIETLHILVSDGFQPVLDNIKPRVTQQLGTNITVTGKPNLDVYKELNKSRFPYDVVIFVENPTYGSSQLNQYLEANSQIVAASRVVLWCPNVDLPKRVTLLDTLFQAKIKTIAVPVKGNMVSNIFIKSVPSIPLTTQLINTDNSLAAWRMARNKQAQCAVTLDKWLRPIDQFVRVSNDEILIRGYINPAQKDNVKAKQVLNLLSSPLIQPLMMRTTTIDLAQNLLPIGTTKRKIKAS